ncbi:MAG TPA: cache domain-containing protein [Casimicrobiaceae bacterium]|nr:cache domain-containing protein [Casimicrobiaceae bacterium]
MFARVNSIRATEARRQIGEDLVAGARLFDRLLEDNTRRLVQDARVVTADYGLRDAIATLERETVTSALVNHGKRIDADLMMVVGLDERVIADTRRHFVGTRLPHAALIDVARKFEQAAVMVVLRGHLHQIAIVQVKAPLPIAWVISRKTSTTRWPPKCAGSRNCTCRSLRVPTRDRGR